MNKRGAIEVQLNWIFVMIIGVIIFSFFIVIANKQKESSENRVAIILKKNIDTFIKASESGENSYKEVQFPATEISLTCDSRGVSSFDVGGRGMKEDLSYDILFSPEMLKGNQLDFWTLDFRMPYKVASFLFLSNSRTKYVFIQDSEGFVDGLYYFMPKDFDRMLIKKDSEGTLTPKNFDYYVFVISTSRTPSLNLDGFKNYKGRISIVNIAASGEDYGMVRFYKSYLVEQAGEAPYLGNESIWGAIFSASPSNYRCNMRKVMTKLRLVSQIYFYRTESLSGQHNDPGDPCYYLYPYPLQNINKIKSNAVSEFTELQFKNIMEAKRALMKNNEALMLKSQCPSVY